MVSPLTRADRRTRINSNGVLPIADMAGTSAVCLVELSRGGCWLSACARNWLSVAVRMLGGGIPPVVMC